MSSTSVGFSSCWMKVLPFARPNTPINDQRLPTKSPTAESAVGQPVGSIAAW